MSALRDVYGNALARYGKQEPRVLVLDADLATSTKTAMFQQVCPERFFDVGIAEANMTAMAAGMASAGAIPFVNTFATFITTIGSLAAKTLIGYSHLNVRLIGSNNSVTGGYDGSTHHSLDDISVMSLIPGMLVLYPSDPWMTDTLTRMLIEEYEGPAYMSVSRNEADPIYADGAQIQIGKANVLREGKDVTLIGYGLCVGRSLKAAEELAQEGIQARVIDMFTLKPLDREAVLSAASETGALVTVEEQWLSGGLKSMVASVLCENQIAVPFQAVGFQDTYTMSGTYDQLIAYYHVDVPDIVQAAKQAVQKKRK